MQVAFAGVVLVLLGATLYTVVKLPGTLGGVLTTFFRERAVLVHADAAGQYPARLDDPGYARFAADTAHARHLTDLNAPAGPPPCPRPMLPTLPTSTRLTTSRLVQQVQARYRQNLLSSLLAQPV